MAYFAQLDENNVVIQVIPASDDYENNGEEIFAQVVGGVWKKTSYNTFRGAHKTGKEPFRKNYASVGFTYDETLDAFIPPKPYGSWILDEETCQWDSPIPYPFDGKDYKWKESTQEWDEVK